MVEGMKILLHLLFRYLSPPRLRPEALRRGEWNFSLGELS